MSVEPKWVIVGNDVDEVDAVAAACELRGIHVVAKPSRYAPEGKVFLINPEWLSFKGRLLSDDPSLLYPNFDVEPPWEAS